MGKGCFLLVLVGHCQRQGTGVDGFSPKQGTAYEEIEVGINTCGFSIGH